MMKALLKNGKVVSPSKKIDELLDIYIEDGIIKEIGKGLKKDQVEIIDLTGKTIVPGFIDMHVHLREPGFEYKETIETGSLSARRGGFTSVCCMPNTNPILDNEDTVRFIEHKSKDLLNDVYVIAAVTKANDGKELAPILELRDAGAIAFSDDAMPVASAEVQRRIMEYITMFDGLFIQHCEDQTLTRGGVMNESFVSTALGFGPIPAISEEIFVGRGIILSEYLNAKYHVAHVSTKGSVDLIRAAKAKGLKVTAEAAPHHFTLTDEAVRSFDTNTKMNPPLRIAEDVEAVKEGLRDGTIDVIATDHAPHAIHEKDVEYAYAPFGIVGLETAVGLTYTVLVENKCISFEEMINKLSLNPRKLLKLPEIKIEVGEKANLTILDVNKEWIVDTAKLNSKSKNSPFNGYKLKCKPVGVVNNNKLELFD
jgi:dihydroorotase